MMAWVISLLPRRLLLWAVATAGVAGLVAVYLWRRDARVARAARDSVMAAIQARELEDRRIVDDVEADVAGLDARERRERLRRWTRD